MERGIEIVSRLPAGTLHSAPDSEICNRYMALPRKEKYFVMDKTAETVRWPHERAATYFANTFKKAMFEDTLTDEDKLLIQRVVQEDNCVSTSSYLYEKVKVLF